MDHPDVSPDFDEIMRGLDEPGGARDRLEREVLADWLPRCRWFGGKARAPRRFDIRDVVALGPARWLFVAASYADGTEETYQVPVTVVRGADAGALPPEAILLRGADATLADGLHDPATRSALHDLIARGGTADSAEGVVRGACGEAFGPANGGTGRLFKVEQSNSSLVFGERVFLKLYRKLEPGLNPDAEITRFLTQRGQFRHVPPFAGAIEYQAEGREPQLLGLAIGLVPNRGDAWSWALAEVAEYFQQTQPHGAPTAGAAVPPGEAFLARVRQLGRRTGELHRALAADAQDPAFAPEPMTGADLQELAGAIRASAARLTAVSDILTAAAPLIEARVAQLAAAQIHTAKIRTHGDYHLGQVLETGGDFVIIDFEGEPSRSLAERRRKRSPLRDVAGMLRSFHYAAHAALAGRADRAALESRAEDWSQAAGEAFLDAWLAATQGAVFVPPSRGELALLLEAFLLEKALYEIAYELNNRPDWLPIPLRGLKQVLGAEHPART